MVVAIVKPPMNIEHVQTSTGKEDKIYDGCEKRLMTGTIIINIKDFQNIFRCHRIEITIKSE